MFSAFVVVVYESLSCQQCEKMDSLDVQKMLENQRMYNTWSISLKNIAEQDCSGQTWDLT